MALQIHEFEAPLETDFGPLSSVLLYLLLNLQTQWKKGGFDTCYYKNQSSDFKTSLKTSHLPQKCLPTKQDKSNDMQIPSTTL